MIRCSCLCLSEQALHFLPLCGERVAQGTTVGTCGMGQTSLPADPRMLMPTALREGRLTVDYVRNPFTPVVGSAQYCPDDIICTDSYGYGLFKLLL